MPMPQISYARDGDLHIAYQHGVMVRLTWFWSGHVLALRIVWEDPAMARFLESLGRFQRAWCSFDKRGTGLSDRIAGSPTLRGAHGRRAHRHGSGRYDPRRVVRGV